MNLHEHMSKSTLGTNSISHRGTSTSSSLYQQHQPVSALLAKLPNFAAPVPLAQGPIYQKDSATRLGLITPDIGDFNNHFQQNIVILLPLEIWLSGDAEVTSVKKQRKIMDDMVKDLRWTTEAQHKFAPLPFMSFAVSTVGGVYKTDIMVPLLSNKAKLGNKRAVMMCLPLLTCMPVQLCDTPLATGEISVDVDLIEGGTKARSAGTSVLVKSSKFMSKVEGGESLEVKAMLGKRFLLARVFIPHTTTMEEKDYFNELFRLSSDLPDPSTVSIQPQMPSYICRPEDYLMPRTLSSPKRPIRFHQSIPDSSDPSDFVPRFNLFSTEDSSMSPDKDILCQIREFVGMHSKLIVVPLQGMLCRSLPAMGRGNNHEASGSLSLTHPLKGSGAFMPHITGHPDLIVSCLQWTQDPSMCLAALTDIEVLFGRVSTVNSPTPSILLPIKLSAPVVVSLTLDGARNAIESSVAVFAEKVTKNTSNYEEFISSSQDPNRLPAVNDNLFYRGTLGSDEEYPHFADRDKFFKFQFASQDSLGKSRVERAVAPSAYLSARLAPIMMDRPPMSEFSIGDPVSCFFVYLPTLQIRFIFILCILYEQGGSKGRIGSSMAIRDKIPGNDDASGPQFFPQSLQQAACGSQDVPQRIDSTGDSGVASTNVKISGAAGSKGKRVSAGSKDKVCLIVNKYLSEICICYS
jgi:hypothetical protein